ncbi:CARDB domain-containing protein [Caldiplasma sukawensis]
MKHNSKITVLIIIIIASAIFVSGISYGHGVSKVNSRSDEIAYSSNSQFSVSVLHPFSVYTGEKFQVHAIMSPGYSNYTVTMFLSADNGTGMNFQHHLNSHSSNVSLNVSAPIIEGQYIQGGIIAVAFKGSSPFYSTAYFSIEVCYPVTIYALLKNGGGDTDHNLSVEFYVNGAPQGEKTISSLPPYSTQIVSITLPESIFNPGTNEISVKLINGTIFSNTVSLSYSSTLYVGNPPNYTWIYYVAGVVIVFMVLLAVGAGRRRTVTGGRPKWASRKKN